jgi:altronate hydrolase
MNRKILNINDKDNVVVALSELRKNDNFLIGNNEIILQEDIRAGHKIAIIDIEPGVKVIKFGQIIGIATEKIVKGSLVHSHNLKTSLTDKEKYTYLPVHVDKKVYSNIPTFQGYKRKSGKVGTRNEIWIINSVGCVNNSAEKIARLCNEKLKRENFDGVFSFSHPYGCSQLGDDMENTRKVLQGLMRNPNAGGLLVLGLGCENLQLKNLLEGFDDFDKDRISHFNSQEVDDEIEEGCQRIQKIFDAMKEDKRVPCPVSDLVLGMKCGGSDSFSGITANPLVGKVSDIMTGYGSKVILTEVPEMFGAEQQLLNRAENEEVYQRIIGLIEEFKAYFISHNKPIYENPSPGNKEGGITTLEEKSLGAIQKGGEAIVTEVLDYGKQASKQGLILLNAPGNDGVSSTAMTVSGATILLFTTGRGTPLGFPVPTIKISSNNQLHERKKNWIDFNAGSLVTGEKTMDELTKELLDYVIKVASGEEKAKNELNGNREIAIWKIGVTL